MFCMLFVLVANHVQSCLCDMDYSPLSWISQQEYGSCLPLPSAEDLPNPEIEPTFSAWQADSLPLSYLRRRS